MKIDLLELETVADAPIDGGTGEAPAPVAEPTDGGTPAPADGGAEPTPAGEPPAEQPAINWDSPEARQAFEQWQADREAQAAAEAEAAQFGEQQQTKMQAVEEALGLLGLDINDFREALGIDQAIAPLTEVAQEYQQQKAVEQIQDGLKQLGQQHPDLLGDGVNALGELKDEAGNALFNPDEIRQTNQQAVISVTVGVLEASKDPRTGQPTIPWTQAAETAAKVVADRDATVRKIAVEQYRRQLEGVSGAPTGVDGGGAGGVARLTGIEGGDETTIARRWLAENRR
jgi:hypothetical protein